MEKIKKTILQAVTTGITACTGTTGTCYVIIPDVNAVYYIKFGLKQSARDLGFFDAFTEPPIPVPPTPPVETFYLVDSGGNTFIDNNGDKFIYE